MNPAEKKKETALFVVGIIFICVLKSWLAADLPIYAIPDATYDDALMVKIAHNLDSSVWRGYRQWLGWYDHFTLVKGPVFPIFLYLIYKLGFPYIGTVTFLYSLSCLFWVKAVKPIVKRKSARLILIAALVFCPISWTRSVTQNVYRNCLIPIQVLLITGGYYGFYLRIKSLNGRNALLYLTVAGIGIATMWYTREDSVWILPFLAVISIVLICIIFTDKDIRKKAAKVFMVFLPAGMILLATVALKAINYHYYGIWTVNEVTDSNFSGALKAIYSVKENDNIQYTSVPFSKLEDIYEVSPAMNGLKEALYEQYYTYGFKTDAQFYWGLRNAVAISGHWTNATEANAYFKKIADEINAAIAEGKLKKTDGQMPSPLASPWREEYKDLLPETIMKALKYIISFSETQAEVKISPAVEMNDVDVDMFETMTGNYAVREDSNAEDVDSAHRCVNRLNRISSIYRTINGFLFLLSLVFETAILFAYFKTQNLDYIKNFLIYLSMVLSVLVLAGGVAYTHVSAYPAIRTTYLAGAYPLIIAAEWISVTGVITLIGKK